MASIEKISLSAEIEQVLKPAFLDDAGVIKHQINQGVAELFRVDNAFFVTRLEDKELVIVALAGQNLDQAAQEIFTAAQKVGCQSIRFHTKRQGLARMLKQFKPTYVETVYRVEV